MMLNDKKRNKGKNKQKEKDNENIRDNQLTKTDRKCPKVLLPLFFAFLLAALAIFIQQYQKDSKFSFYHSLSKFFDESPNEDLNDIKNTYQNKNECDNYDFKNITNDDDCLIKDEIDNAQNHIDIDPDIALKKFNAILTKNPISPRSLYGKAKSLDILAEKRKSNSLLQKAIATYLQLVNANNIPIVLFQLAAERCVNRMQFIGHYGKAIPVHKKLIEKFPDVPKFRDNLAVTYLTINRINEARTILLETLTKWPNDGVALVHYGFILKTTDNKLEEAVDYMKRGIKSKEPGVIDGRFYFHLGDALARLKKPKEAMEIYEEGVKNNLFLSKYQRSLYNVNRLTGRAWWNLNETPYQAFFNLLEKNWKEIRNEGLAVLNRKGYFQDESENLKDTGDWKQFELFARGVKNIENCKKCPLTCKLIESLPDAKNCKRGQTKFSVMHPGTHVWPHCGPTNCRLRAHLGLKVPYNTYIRVAETTKSWEEGKVFLFDDSFEHEVWHNGTEFRLVLIIDVWHPELTPNEKNNLSAI